MPRNTKPTYDIDAYEHAGKTRLNNPPPGLVTEETDPDSGVKTYSYDPHLDPQLIWAGKAEHTSFDVPTVSLHGHERIDPRTIVEAVRKQPDPDAPTQLSLFAAPQENPPIRQAIEFYKHSHGWSNRQAAGDSLLVMNSLQEEVWRAANYIGNKNQDARARSSRSSTQTTRRSAKTGLPSTHTLALLPNPGHNAHRRRWTPVGTVHLCCTTQGAQFPSIRHA